MRVPAVFPLLLAVPLTSPSAAQPPAVPASAEFTFPDYIAQDCDSLFVLGDVMPPLRRVLGSDTFRRYAAEGKLARIMAADGVDLSQSLAKLEAKSPFIPAEVAIGFPSASYTDFVNMIKLALATGLCSGATTAGGESIEIDLPRLQVMALEAAQAVEMPKLTLWVRFRDQQTAAALFGWIRAAAPQITARGGVDVRVEAGAVHLKSKLGDMLPAQVFTAVLANWGVAPTPDDPKLAEIAAAIADIEAEAWIERLDDGLRLTLGTQPKQNAAYPVQTLGTLWRADRPPIFFAKWHIAQLKSGVGDIAQTWRDWSETETGKVTKQLDKEDPIGTLMFMVDQIERASESATIHVTTDRSLDITMHEQGFAPIESLATSPLTTFLPRDAELIKVDARRSFADHLAYSVARLEDRLAKRQLQDDLSGRDERAAQGEQVIEYYYEHFAHFRRVVFEGAPHVFAKPFAVLAGSRGKIERVELRFDDANSTANSVTVVDAPFMEYAAIGRLSDPSRTAKFFNDLSRGVLGGFLDEVPEELIGPRDLGLGIETFAFQTNPFAGDNPNISISVVGDLDPHYFMVDDWIVVSTSIRLSKSILAALRDPAQRFAAPNPGNAHLAAFGVIPGETIASIFDHIWTLASDAFSGKGSVTLAGPISVGVTSQPFPSEALVGIGEIIRLLDHFSWTTVDGTQVRVTRASAKFKGFPASE